MGFWSSGYKEIKGFQPYLDRMNQFGDTLGGNDFGTRQARGLLKQLGKGDYSNIMGSYLNPIRDAAATQQRESERSMQMGANALYQGTQPALMAGLGEESRLRAGQQLGQNMAAAIPQLWGQAQQAYGAGRGRSIDEEQLRAQLLEAAMRGKIGANQMTPSTLSQIGQGAGSLMGGLGGLAMGFGF